MAFFALVGTGSADDIVYKQTYKQKLQTQTSTGSQIAVPTYNFRLKGMIHGDFSYMTENTEIRLTVGDLRLLGGVSGEMSPTLKNLRDLVGANKKFAIEDGAGNAVFEDKVISGNKFKPQISMSLKWDKNSFVVELVSAITEYNGHFMLPVGTSNDGPLSGNMSINIQIGNNTYSGIVAYTGTGITKTVAVPREEKTVKLYSQTIEGAGAFTKEVQP